MSSARAGARILATIGFAVILGACGRAALLVGEGECFDNPDGVGAIVRNVDVVPCDEPHDNEMYAVVEYPDPSGVYPGDETIQEFAQQVCIERFEEFVDFPYRPSELDLGFLWPQQDAWDVGDRSVQCFVFELDGSQVTGSLRNARR